MTAGGGPGSWVEEAGPEHIGEYRVLSLSGGGVRGIFQASFLEHLEDELGPVADRFDLIAATSTGALVGLGLAAGLPASQITSIYRDHADKIFKRRHGALLRKGPRYSNEPLRRVLEQTFEDRRLGDVSTEVLICASALDRYQGKAFSKADRDLRLVDAALASAAAPTFFPPVVPDHSHRGYIDGGLWANDPLLTAISAAHARGVDPGHVEALALGTGRVTKGATASEVAAMRPLSQETARFLIDTTGSLQESSGAAVVEQLTDAKVHRVNPELVEWIGLDQSARAIAKLPGIAEMEYESRGAEIRDWLAADRRDAVPAPSPLSPVLEEGIREAGISRIIPERRFYAIYREGRESISSYVRRTTRTLTMVSINLAVGAELERIERVFGELLDENPELCIRVSLLDPSDQVLMEATSRILDDVSAEQIAERIAGTMRKLQEFRASLDEDLRSQVELFHHRTIPSASAILIDVNSEAGLIQLETKPYKAAPTQSWALEIKAGTDFFETMRSAYHSLIEDGFEV